jgi:tetratricopeptide (TPR) repeat protein
MLTLIDPARERYAFALARAAQGDTNGAIAAFETAVLFAPDFAEAHCNLAELYLQSDRTNEAIAALQAAVHVAPELPEAHVLLYRAYRRSERAREALAAAWRALELRPERDAYMDLGVAALELDAFDVALDANRRALELDPQCAAAHSNLGWIHHLSGSYRESIAACRAAIALRPDLVFAHLNYALSLLVGGDFARGWDEYAWIWSVPDRVAHYRHLDRATMWNGAPFPRKRLLVTLDQGLGDAIQMARYFPALKARGGHVSVEVLAPLAALFADLPGVDELRVGSAGASEAAGIDLHVPMLALPRLLGTRDIQSIPAPIPYLRAQPERLERWRPRMHSPARLRVGVVWAGNADHPNDRRRSVRLEDFATLADVADIAWFGLQKGREETRFACGSFVLDPLGPEITDLADTAAIVAHLDLIIAVDTSIVHLAGALGKPVWTLLAFAPDWRWLLGRNDSPWYPTMRLFRQPSPGDWASVFASVASELRTFDPARCAGPDAARAHYERAKMLAAQGDIAGAIAAYESSVAGAPDFALAHSNLGGLYLQSGRPEDALRAYRTAVGAQPDLAPLSSNLAAALIELERYDEAIEASLCALQLAPELAAAHENLARAYRRSGRERDALGPALRAIDARPNRAAYIELGTSALGLDAFEIAIAANRRALELDGSCAGAYNNLGGAYHAMGRYAEAIAACDAALALQPDFALAHFNRGLSLLVRGDFERGWADYEWTFRVPANRARYPYLDRVPLWMGEPCAGRRLLLTLDQGLGDAIQMIRYVPALKARGAHVIVEVNAPLVELFSDLPGIDELRLRPAAGAPNPDVDAHVPLFGLPRALGTLDRASIPAPIPYLRALPERTERWRSRLQRRAGLRVGIVWAGNPEHANDRHRSVRLEDFAVLAEVAGIAWFGLQKGRDEARRCCGALTLEPLGADIADFADSAAIVEQLDLVIAVDTAIVHLAGALGKPVWTLLPFVPDWRWLLERDDSPWYPTMRLFRQPAIGDWAPVFAAVARELRALVAAAALR